MINKCPRCQNRYQTSQLNTDFIHTCNSGDTTLDNEDVLVIGNFEDYTGSGSFPKQSVMHAGTANELQGTDADAYDKATFGGVTKRGNTTQTHRTRQHLEFIRLKK